MRLTTMLALQTVLSPGEKKREGIEHSKTEKGKEKEGGREGRRGRKWVEGEGKRERKYPQANVRE